MGRMRRVALGALSALVLLVAVAACEFPGVPPGQVVVEWATPDGATLSGPAAPLVAYGQALVNVEFFRNGTLLARATVTDAQLAVATIDTTRLADGPLTVSAHGWNSPPGTPYTSEDDAGARTFVIANHGSPTTTTTRPGCGPRPTIPDGPPLLGVYTGNDPNGIRAFETWLGDPVDGILGYTGDASWADYDGSVGWAMGVWNPSNRPVLWSVPLIPRGATLEAAAAGDYNSHYVGAAQKLATFRPQDPVLFIRTGWEFNGNWFPWTAQGKPEAFKGAFRQFVDSFRSVSNRFVFEWNVNVGDVGMNPETAYPGDCYVDIIGMDFYWNTQWDPTDPNAAWQSMLTRSWGLNWHQSFAAAHGKPTAYSEWGVDNNGAGPYIDKAAQWFASHDVVYQTYWDSDNAFRGKLSNGQFPLAAAAYLRNFG